MNEDFLYRRLKQRQDNAAYRELTVKKGMVDFCSNDYLGIVHHKLIRGGDELQERYHGSTGSRLISGNDAVMEKLEQDLAEFHQSPAALLFNSGYDANLGLLGTVPQRLDTVVYDQLSHASIRDGIRLSHASSYAFLHNDLDDLEKKLQAAKGNIFVVTESVFSMDGDLAPLEEISRLCELYHAQLIVDEAHATGVVGDQGQGLVQSLNLEKKCFARIHTFGKAVGCHGAVILGSELLRQFLVNFSRPFIYTTAMPVAAAEAIAKSYSIFPGMRQEREQLQRLVEQFREAASALRLCPAVTAIQGVVIPGNEQVKAAAAALQQEGMDVRAILHPTVPKGQERLRIVLHAYNKPDEVKRLVEILVTNQ